MSYSYQNSLASRQSRNLNRRNRDVNTYKAVTAGLGPVSTTLFIVVVIGITALLYLTQITKTTAYGYQVNELSQQQKQLVERNQELQIEASRLRAIARIEESRVADNLESEDSLSFAQQN